MSHAKFVINMVVSSFLLPIKFFTFKYIANVEICTNQKMATPQILTKIIEKDPNYNSSTSKSKNTI
jgi:hypothetical protein